ncbi:MAG: hypothetical protein Q4A55_00220 [Aerococcus sp.]|nr:hypothetical protein [Aerococcus sp.]
MATIEAIKEQILDKIRQEEKEKLTADKRQVAEHTAKKEQAIADDLTARKQAIERKYQQRVQTQLQQFNAQQRHQELQQQDRLMQDVFKGALEKLHALPEDQLLKLVKQALQTVGDQPSELRFGALNQAELSKDAFDQLKADYPKLTISTETMPRVGGFILSQSAVDYNYTYQALLDEQADGLSARFLAEVAKASGEGE